MNAQNPKNCLFLPPIAAALAVMLAAGLASARPDFTFTGSPVPIPDGTGTGTPGAAGTATITIPAALTVASLTCSIHVPHSFQGDLRLRLTHVESGRNATLIDRPYVPQTALGFPAPDYGTPQAMLLFVDSAAAVYDAPTVAPPGITGVSGAWRPQSALSVFVGYSAQGTWRLTAIDYAAGDTGSIIGFKLSIGSTSTCYANCDASTGTPFLTAADFQCFLNRFSAGDLYVNCDASVTPPVLNIMDFQCYLNRFAAGCSAP